MSDEQVSAGDDQARRAGTRRWRKRSLALIAAALTLGTSVPAAHAAAPSRVKIMSADQCRYQIVDNGTQLRSMCPYEPLYIFWYTVDACGPGSCQQIHDDFHYADGLWHTWRPGGYIADVISLYYRYDP